MFHTYYKTIRTNWWESYIKINSICMKKFLLEEFCSLSVVSENLLWLIVFIKVSIKYTLWKTIICFYSFNSLTISLYEIFFDCSLNIFTFFSNVAIKHNKHSERIRHTDGFMLFAKPGEVLGDTHACTYVQYVEFGWTNVRKQRHEMECGGVHLIKAGKTS